MSFLDRAYNTGQRLINKYGSACVLESNEVIVDPDKPWVGESVFTSINITACFVPLRLEEYKTMKAVEGSVLPKGAQMALICDRDITPKLGDLIRRPDGKVLSILNYTSVNPDASNPVLYKIAVVE